jgi:NSS family neurotransmitter:Na+ symporter
MPKNDSLESLGNRLCFIFLSAGCAIVLGDVWRFPYVAGINGGGAFVLLFLIFLAILVMSIAVMEFAVGHRSRQSVAQSFTIINPRSPLCYYGWFGLAGNYLLLMFYTVVTGWLLAYFWRYAGGHFIAQTPRKIEASFAVLLASPGEIALWLGLVVFAGAGIYALGLRASVERATKVMMGGLLTVMLALAAQSLMQCRLRGAGAIVFYHERRARIDGDFWQLYRARTVAGRRSVVDHRA